MSASRQKGFTLFVGLIILFLMTLVAVTTFNITTNDAKVALNMQEQDQARRAAQEALDRLLSSPRFTTTPTAVFESSGCTGTATVTNGICVDLDGDGKNVQTVRMDPIPQCLIANPIKNATLNLLDPQDAGCALGASQNFGIEGASGLENSLCADTTWSVSAIAADTLTNATTTLGMGVGIRTTMDSVAANCP